MAALLLAACGAVCAQQNISWALPNFYDRLEVRVSNPSAKSVHTLAAIDIAKARAVAPGFPGTLAIVPDLPHWKIGGDEVSHRAGRLMTPEGGNEIVLSRDWLRTGHEVSLTYRVAAAWQGSGWTSPVQHVADVLQEETAQPVVTLLQHESTPHPERLASERQ